MDGRIAGRGAGDRVAYAIPGISAQRWAARHRALVVRAVLAGIVWRRAGDAFRFAVPSPRAARPGLWALVRIGPSRPSGSGRLGAAHCAAALAQSVDLPLRGCVLDLLAGASVREERGRETRYENPAHHSSRRRGIHLAGLLVRFHPNALPRRHRRCRRVPALSSLDHCRSHPAGRRYAQTPEPGVIFVSIKSLLDEVVNDYTVSPPQDALVPLHFLA